MLPLETRTTWILLAWLTPVGWSTLLMLVACVANRFPSQRRSASGLFDRLESTSA